MSKEPLTVHFLQTVWGTNKNTNKREAIYCKDQTIVFMNYDTAIDYVARGLAEISINTPAINRDIEARRKKINEEAEDKRTAEIKENEDKILKEIVSLDFSFKAGKLSRVKYQLEKMKLSGMLPKTLNEYTDRLAELSAKENA